MQIAPSILSADFVNFQRDIERVANADLLHVDVMDAHFVPNLTWGLPVTERICEISPIPVDAHLMIDDPDAWAVRYAEAGCASVTFHAEASSDPAALAGRIRAAGARSAVAVKPGTAPDEVIAHLDAYDMVLVMTVEPGFGGQSFMPDMMDKVRRVREAALARGIDLDIQVDGGIARDTIPAAASAGANVFVAGSAVYGAPDPAAEIDALRELAREAGRA